MRQNHKESQVNHKFRYMSRVLHSFSLARFWPMHGTDRTAYVERKKKKRVKKMYGPISPAKKTRRTSPARVRTEKGLKTEYCNKTLWMGTALQIIS